MLQGYFKLRQKRDDRGDGGDVEEGINMINKQLIENRIHNFLGYGNLDSHIWFIGMEEGGNDDEDDLKNRFLRTNNKRVVDIQDGTKDIKVHSKWFSQEKPPLQRTWSKLIRILLVLNSEKGDDREKIREFQKNCFARKDSNHCILELMPLPCKSTKDKDWHYGKYGIDYLKTRKEYLEEITRKRIILFKEIINQNNPETVIFYSFTYKNKWEEIIGYSFEKILFPSLNNDKYIYFHDSAKTKYFVIPHPTARGYTNDDWNKIAEKIRNKFKISVLRP